MGLTDLLELSLNLLNSLIFEVFNFLQSALYYSEGLRINLSCSEELVNLCILSLKPFLNGLELLLKD